MNRAAAIFGLQLAAAIVLGLAIGGVAYVVASAPTRVASRLGMRGLKRQKILESNGAWRGVEPLVRWLGVRLGGLVGEATQIRVDEQLALAGDFLGLTVDEFFAFSILCGCGAAVLGAVLGTATGLGPILIVLVGLFGGAAPWLHVSGEAQERSREISRGLPYAIDLMALSMSAGLDFPGAVRQVVERSSNPRDPLVEELTLLLQMLSLGRTRREALEELGRRVPNPAVREFVSALVQAEERGNPVADVLLIQATTSRQRRSEAAEEIAAKTGAKLLMPMMLVFIAVLGLLLSPVILTMMTSGL